MVNWLLDDVIKWLLAKAVLASLNALWGLLATTAFTSPDVTVLPQVAAITSKAQTVVNVSFVLAVITAGITVMTHETVQVRYGIGELLPRLVVGFIASNFSTPLCKQLIVTANALTRALTGEGVGSQDSFAHLLRVITDAMEDPANAFLLAVIGLILAGLTAMLLVTWLVRIGVLIVLVGIAPVALACHATPYTDGAARLWWRSILGLLATVLLQALALHTTLDIFLSSDANLPALGLPQDTGILNLFIIICLLWTVVKIPGLMRRYVMGGGGQHNIAGLLVRMVLVQQLSRVFRIPRFGRGSRAAAAAGTARGAGGSGGGPSVASTVIPYWRPRLPRPTPATAGTATPAGTSAGASGGQPAARPRPRIPAGVTPATAMPKTRPAWKAGGRPTAPARQTVPAGVTPATAMPPRRPAWQGGQPATPAGPAVPPGVTPATAMPKQRPSWVWPTWQATSGTAARSGGGTQPGRRVPGGVNPATAMPRTRPAWRRP
ncbi:conjugal transfer protein TrbL family protein [Actinomycetes bacterium KLBMP 9797]